MQPQPWPAPRKGKRKRDRAQLVHSCEYFTETSQESVGKPHGCRVNTRSRLWCPLAKSIEKALCGGNQPSAPHADTKDGQEEPSAPKGILEATQELACRTGGLTQIHEAFQGVHYLEKGHWTEERGVVTIVSGPLGFHMEKIQNPVSANTHTKPRFKWVNGQV